MDQVRVDHGELAGQVRFDVQVLVRRLDGLRHANDVGDGRGRGDGHDVGVADAFLDALADRRPIQGFGQVDIDVLLATGLDEDLLGIQRQDALGPQRALEAGVGAALVGQVTGGLDGEVADGFHGLVGEVDGGVGTVGDVLQVQRVLEAHDAQAHRAVLEVGVLRLRHAVVVDVDDVIEHAYSGAHGALQLGGVELAVLDVVDQVDRAQVADGDLVLVGVQRDLGAQVRAVHHADVLLRAAQVARVLEGQPRVAGLEQHREHLAPQVLGRQGLEQLDLAVLGQLLVVLVTLLEGAAGEVVQVGDVGRGEQGPGAVVEDALHEQVRNPVGGVHVVGAATVVTGVLAQLEEFLDVQVPGFQVGADRALAFAALVDRDGGVVDHFEEGHDALGFAVGALDVGAQCAHRGPVVAQAAGELGEQGVIADGVVDAAQVVRHGGQVARRQLRTQGAGVEQGRRGGHVVEGRQQVVELDGAGFFLLFLDGQAHGDAHEEDLRQLEADVVLVDEVAVVQRLQAEVGELLVALVVECGAQLGQVVALELGIEQFELDAFLDVGRQRLGVQVGHLVMGGGFGNAEETQGFGTQGVHQQACGDLAVVRLTLDQGAGSHHQRGVDVLLGHAVVEVLQGFTLDQRAIDLGQAFAGFGDDGLQATHVQRLLAAVGAGDADARVRLGDVVGRGALALLATGFAVDHVVTRDLLLTGAHQGQFDLVLDFFDMDSATGGHATTEGGADLLGQARDGVVNTRGSGSVTAFHCEKGLGDGDGDLVVGVGDDGTVALDHAQLARGGSRQIRCIG